MLLRWATGSAISGGLRRRALSRILVIVAIAATAYFHPHVASAESQTDAQTLAEQAIRRLDLQTELRREDDPQPPLRLQLPPETIWIAVAIGVVILLYAFRDLIPVLRAGRSGDWAEDEAAAKRWSGAPPQVEQPR